MRDRHSGHPRGFGFVSYDDEAIADRVAAERHELDGRQVEAKRAVPRSECVPATRTHMRATKKVFVGGLPSICGDTELYEYFARFGDIAESQVMYDHQTSNSRGFGFVTFSNETTVDRVVNMDHDIMGKFVEVKRAEPKQVLEARRNNPPYGTAPAVGAHSQHQPPPHQFLGNPSTNHTVSHQQLVHRLTAEDPTHLLAGRQSRLPHQAQGAQPPSHYAEPSPASPFMLGVPPLARLSPCAFVPTGAPTWGIPARDTSGATALVHPSQSLGHGLRSQTTLAQTTSSGSPQATAWWTGPQTSASETSCSRGSEHAVSNAAGFSAPAIDDGNVVAAAALAATESEPSCDLTLDTAATTGMGYFAPATSHIPGLAQRVHAACYGPNFEPNAAMFGLANAVQSSRSSRRVHPYACQSEKVPK